MSGGKGGTTVGYKYYLGILWTLCQTPIDRVLAIKFEDKVAWEGLGDSGSISIDEPQLFGGENKEGGVSGTVDILTGDSTQTVNDYLALRQPVSGFLASLTSWLSTNFPIFAASEPAGQTYQVVPAYRGLFQLVFRQIYIGNNPFLKALRFKLQNIFSTFGGWEPSLAPINPEILLNNVPYYIAIENSYKTGKGNFVIQQRAVAKFLKDLIGTKGCSVHIVMYADTIIASTEIINCTDTDFNTLITWVDALDPNSTGIGVDYDIAISEAAAFFTAAIGSPVNVTTQLSASPWFSIAAGTPGTLINSVLGSVLDATQATSRDECIILLTQGSPVPSSSIAAANATLASTMPNAKVFCYNVTNTDTTSSIQIDNTTKDGVPILHQTSSGGASYSPAIPTGTVLQFIESIPCAGYDYVEWNASVYLKYTALEGGGPAPGALFIEIKCIDSLGAEIPGYTITDEQTLTGGISCYLMENLPSNIDHIDVYGSVNATYPLFTIGYGPNSALTLGFTTTYDTDISTIQGSVASWSDLNPAHILRDLALNPKCGGNGDATTIGTSFLSAAITLFNEGLGISIANTSPSSRDSFKQDIERYINGHMYMDEITGKWELYLVRQDYTVGSLIVFDSSNIIDWPDEPVKPLQQDIPNQITVKYTNRVDGSPLSVTLTNTAAVQQVGVIIPKDIDYPGVTTDALAYSLASRDLASLTVPGFSGTIKVYDIDPSLHIGSPIIINEPNVGMNNVVCRIVSIKDVDGISPSTIIQYTQDNYGLQVSDLTSGLTTASLPDKSALPPTAELVMEAPYWNLVLLLGQSQVDTNLTNDPDMGYAIATCNRPSQFHTIETLARNDASGWVSVGSGPFAPYVVMTSTLDSSAASTTFKTGYDDTLADLRANDLIQIDDEIMRIDSMSMTAGIVTWTVGRGCLDTVPSIHGVGAAVIAYSEFYSYDQTQYTAGEAIDYRVQPRTSLQSAELASIATKTVTFSSRAQKPYHVGKLQIDGLYVDAATLTGSHSFTWTHRDRLLQTGTTPEDFTAASIGPEAGDVYYSLRRTMEMKTDFFAVADVFAERWFFCSSTYGSEMVQAFGTTQPVTASMSLDDIDFFAYTDVFAQADFFAGAWTSSTLAMELGVRVVNGSYTNWQDAVIQLKPLLTSIGLTISEV